jgi:hypothetical protein
MRQLSEVIIVISWQPVHAHCLHVPCHALKGYQLGMQCAGRWAVTVRAPTVQAGLCFCSERYFQSVGARGSYVDVYDVSLLHLRWYSHKGDRLEHGGSSYPVPSGVILCSLQATVLVASD